MDFGGLDFSHHWYRLGKLVGVLRTWLGWMVVLGSCGKCQLPAMAFGDCPFALNHRRGKKINVKDLDDFVGHSDICHVVVGNILGAFGCPYICSFLCK